jgi:drug/metabolite transporter (DMT)-like permease
MIQRLKEWLRSGKLDLALLVVANASWGSADVVVKLALTGLPPAVVAWVRFGVAMLVFGPVLWVRRAELPRSVTGHLPYVALGACGYCLNFLFNYQGLTLTTAAHATALRVSEALMIVVLSAVLLRERLRPRALVGLGLGLIGVGLIVDLRLSELSLFGKGYRWGDLLILTGMAIECLYTPIGKKTLATARPLTASALACAWGWVLLTCLAAPEVVATVQSPPATGSLMRALVGCVYLGLIPTVVGYAIWFWVLDRRASHRVGMTVMLQPVVGLPLAAAVLGDRLGGGFLAGTVLVVVAVYLALGGSGSSMDAGKAERAR